MTRSTFPSAAGPVCGQHLKRLQLPYYVMYAVLGVLGFGILAAIPFMMLEMAEVGSLIAGGVLLLALPAMAAIIVLQLMTPRAEAFFDQTVDRLRPGLK